MTIVLTWATVLFMFFFLILQNLFLNFIEIERHLTVKVVII